MKSENTEAEHFVLIRNVQQWRNQDKTETKLNLQPNLHLWE